MASSAQNGNWQHTIRDLSRNGTGILVLILALLGMLILPLPPFLLDLFFTFNIALSLVVLFAVIYVQRPMDFSAFPSVLLIATLLRLALNVASTRVVLIEGHNGPGAAGQVIESFGHFIIGGNFAVGIVVFMILVIINFMVVTKGAGRVSEVTARFTLDAMPGKQMAIDADLNAGVLTQEEARKRREDVRIESDFYGAMDGASKFVKGDAIAGILILFINLIGGMIIGVLQHDLSAGTAAEYYVLLSIGDGLVAQIPALLLSIAVAIIVTRISRSGTMSEQVVGQMFDNSKVLYLSGVILLLIGIIPGMPHLVFLLLGGACMGGGWLIDQKALQPEVVSEGGAAAAGAGGAAAGAAAAKAPTEVQWEDVTQQDVIGLEVGYRLIPLVDRNQGGELVGRITGVRKKLSKDLGFLVQSVHIRDNLDMPPTGYRLLVLGDVVAQGEIQPGMDLAINPGQVHGTLRGLPTRDPAFGMEALWIEPALRDQAQSLGYTVVDTGTVIATHLSQVIRQHAHELLGHEEVQQLLDRLAQSDPRLVENLVPKQLPLSVVVRVLQNLLREGVSIRSLRLIAESLAEQAPRTKNPDELLEGVRIALGRMIVQEINGLDEEMPVMVLDPELEQILLNSIRGGAGSVGLEPGLAERMQQGLADYARRQEALGQPAVLLVSPGIRSWISRFIRRSIPSLAVLSYNEVPDNKQVRLVTSLGPQGRLTQSG
ncbi:flagellar biosynthesis protein FlhA [Perlucidibaca piscinae]|uniref:flagellar biosynthesis protein FlhA n=1 Tax=Perlucidibaca piscinae TaxID=392589 RepID=UPI0003B57EC4|nr:flagellar biosynthesis protein FlhA [Perlucidibaca piscinae]